MYLPIFSSLFPPSCKMNGSSQPRPWLVVPGSVPECGEDLDVDKETVEERKSKLNSHCQETKTDPKAATPFFSTNIKICIAFPLDK